MMQKAVLGLLLLAAGVFCDTITPPKCDNGNPGYGAGDATLTAVRVTNLSGSPAYNMKTKTNYTCEFDYTAARNVANPKFAIFASINGLDCINFEITNPNVPPMTTGQSGTGSASFTIPDVFGVIGKVTAATFWGRIYDADAPEVDSDSATVVCYTGNVNIKCNSFLCLW